MGSPIREAALREAARAAIRMEGRGENPKDRLGIHKIPFGLTSGVARIWWAMAMADGARKYGEYNWREKSVKISVYLDAADRHIAALRAGEDLDYDPNRPPPFQRIPHAGLAMACLSIIEDARASGALVDDRRIGDQTARVLSELTAVSAYGKATATTSPAPAKTRTEAGEATTFDQFLSEITQRDHA